MTQGHGNGFAVLDRFFAIDMPFWRFARNTLAVSCLSLLPPLLLFVVLTPGFGASLLEGGPALRHFLRQVVANGVPVVFAVNYVGFFLYAAMRGRGGERVLSPFLVLLIDLPARVLVFVILHGVIYVGAAHWFDSFGGDGRQALRVVGPTLARAATFDNISGVYLYATLVSALPLYLAAVERIVGTGRNCPGARRALVARIITVLALFVVVALTLTGLAALLARL